MSRARHRMKGGGVKETVYAGEGSNALKEAMEKKHGGKVMHGEGEEAKHRGDRKKRARGGGVPGRARGGGVGADRMPLTTAAKVKQITKGETPEAGEPSD